nr:hypothetical protein [Tanacetum cinerariifolium]
MAKTINGEVQIHAQVDGKEIVIIESSVRRDLQLADKEGIDCLPNSTIFEQIALMGKPKRKDTQVPQSNGPTDNVADEVVHKELGDRLVRAATTASSLEAEHDSGGPRCQETMRDTTAQTRVLDLEKTKTSQRNEIDSLKRRVKKLENRNRSRTHKQKRLYKVGLTARVESFDNKECLGEDASKNRRRIDAIDVDDEITLVNGADNEMFNVDDLGALKALKTSKPKVKGIVFHEPCKSTTTTTIVSSQHSKAKGKGIMIEEPVKAKKKDQIRLDEKAALKLQDKFNEKERLTRERAKKEQKANIALIETWDDIQAKIGADHQLAERLQEQEQEELYKLKDLKLKEFDSIKEMFDKAFRSVNTFEDFRIELLKGKEKRVGEELIQESTKKKKVKDDKEKAELKQLMETILDEEELEINTIPLAVKSSRIVDWQIHKEGKKSYYQIVRADGKS